MILNLDQGLQQLVQSLILIYSHHLISPRHFGPHYLLSLASYLSPQLPPCIWYCVTSVLQPFIQSR